MSHIHTPPNARENDAGRDLNGHVAAVLNAWKKKQRLKISRKLTIVVYDDGSRFNQVETDEKIVEHGQFV